MKRTKVLKGPQGALKALASITICLFRFNAYILNLDKIGRQLDLMKWLSSSM